MVWMVYGANGYTGRLIAEAAKERGIPLILAGRTPQRIANLSTELGFDCRIFDLTNVSTIAKHLEDCYGVLNCAGPFRTTVKPMLEACIRSSTHYLDLTGEVEVFEHVFARHADLQKAGIFAIPGVGFDVVPSDTLAAVLKRHLPDATHLNLAIASQSPLSPGTARTIIEGAALGGWVRRNGELKRVPSAYMTALLPVSSPKNSLSVSIPWGDLSTAWRSTRIPNITTYFTCEPYQFRQLRASRYVRWLLRMPPILRMLRNQVAKKHVGPTAEERLVRNMSLYGEVRNPRGQRVAMRMRTPNSYLCTVDAALSAINNLTENPISPGATTPSIAFGAEFALGLTGIDVEVIQTEDNDIPEIPVE